MSDNRTIINTANGVEVEASPPSPQWIRVRWRRDEIRLLTIRDAESLVWCLQRTIDEAKARERQA